MRIKRKTHKKRIRIFIKINSILHTLRCIEMKIKTSMRYTFFMSNFDHFWVLKRFGFRRFVLKN